MKDQGSIPTLSQSDAQERRSPTPRSAGKKRPKPARGEAFGILNPYGDLWTFETFKTEAGARDYIEAFWRSPGFERSRPDTSKFTVIPVKVTVSAK